MVTTKIVQHKHQVYVIDYDYGVYTLQFDTIAEAQKAEMVRDYLLEKGWLFKCFKCWWPNEALIVSAAVKKTKNYVFWLTDRTPYIDNEGLASASIKYSEGSCPVGGLCLLEVWEAPIPDNQVGEKWNIYDGISPINFDDRNESFIEVMFTTAELANEFVDKFDKLYSLEKFNKATDEAIEETLSKAGMAVERKPDAPSISDKMKVLELTPLKGHNLHHMNKEIFVHVPEDMTFEEGGSGPGAFDYIKYKGIQITYAEMDAEYPIPYEGPWIILSPESGMYDETLKTLDAVRTHIDSLATSESKPANVESEMTLTIAQAKKLHERWMQFEAAKQRTFTFADFLDSVSPVFGGEGAVTVPWKGMWLCIEPNGYCHS